MSVVEEFEKLIDNNCNIENLIDFLNSLSNNNKRCLVPTIKKLDTEYRDKYFTTNTHKILTLPIQIQKSTKTPNNDAILLSGIACMDEKAFNTLIGCKNIAHILEKYNVINWGIQPWFHNYLEKNPYCINNYSNLVRYVSSSCLHPSKDTILKILLRDIHNETTLHDMTIDTHLWYIFDASGANINLIKKEPWINIFNRLLNEKRISQDKVLNEFITAPQESIYFEILSKLTIDTKMFLKHQKKLISLLDSSNSKIVNLALKLIYKIAKEDTFEVVYFLEFVPLLFSTHIKSIQNTSLSIVNILLKYHKIHKNSLVILLPLLFAHKDNKLQIKVLKILEKQNAFTKDILREIEPYYVNFFTDAKAMLPTSFNIPNIQAEIINQIEPIQSIVYPNKFNDLIFFFSQVFENNELHSFDLVLTNILTIDKLLTTENMDKFIPAIQTAYKVAHASNYNKGLVIYIGIDLLLRYAQHLAKKFPEHNAILNTIMTEMPYFNYINYKVYCYKPFIHMSRLVQRKLQDGNNVSLLSTPTHKPCYIEMSTLAQRVCEHEKYGLPIDHIDLQIALNRVIQTNKIIDQIEKIKSSELKTLLHYVNNKNSLNIQDIINPELWITAVLRQNNYQDIEIFKQKFESSKENIFPYLLPSWDVGFIDYSNGLYGKDAQYSLQNMTPRKGVNFKHKLFYITSDIDNIYTQINTIHLNYDIHKNDDEKFILLSPYNIDSILLNSMRVHNYDKSFPRANVLRHSENILPLLMELWQNNPSGIVYLYLAISIINNNANTQILACDLWIKVTFEGTMNHQLLGETLGKLEHNEYAPLKRFTDLIVANMLNISSLHNKGLHTLLSAMITQMNDEPIKGTKKLLEIYLEVLNLTKLDVPSEALDKLKVWGEVKSLRGIVNKLAKG